MRAVDSHNLGPLENGRFCHVWDGGILSRKGPSWLLATQTLRS